MSNLLLCVHVAAAIAIRMDSRRRGRSPIVWTLLTLIPNAIFVTWPLLYILPRLTPPPDVRNGAQDEPTVASQERLGQIGNLRLTTNNRSFYVGVTVWVVCLIVIGIGIVIGKHSPEALANRVQQNSQQFDRARLAAEMLDKVTHRAGRMYDLCSYVGTVAAQFRMEALVPLSTCERIRTGQNDVIARD